MAALLQDPKKVYDVSDTRDPTASDDVTQGIAVNARWQNTSSGTVWVCKSNTFNAAVWTKLDASGATLSAADVPLLNRAQIPAFTVRGFTGLAAPGAVTVAGLGLGMKVLAVFSIGGATTNAAADFEATVSVAGQLQQTGGGDLHTEHFVVIAL